MATYTLKAGTSWNDVWARCRAVAPEAFDVDRSRNLVAGQWVASGEVAPHQLSIDGSQIAGPPLIDEPEAQRAIAAATAAHREWGRVSLDERRARVAKAVELLSGQRELLALLLVWEIGKPWRLACADVDRALDGVRWYLGEIERQLQGRAPLPGPVSNIASWNYPMSVLVHAELVQLLAGNAVVSKTPSQGGFHCLTLAHAMLHRAGLPVTLVSGTGARIGSTLVRGPGLGALAFVGGRANGRRVALDLADTGRRYMLEEEGLNAWGVWDFSNWAELGAHLKKGFEYGKQRCTAYPRYVVQRRLLPEFLEMYLERGRASALRAPARRGAPRRRLPRARLRARHQRLEGRGDGRALRLGGGLRRRTGRASTAGARPLPPGAGHLGICSSGLRARAARVVGAAAPGALRSARLHRARRHRDPAGWPR
jgi:acyl-CoA reductase-like NAD-dependent aldehyde dehydrogenase